MATDTLNRWFQRMSLGAMLVVAAGLVAVGVGLYGPRLTRSPDEMGREDKVGNRVPDEMTSKEQNP